MFENCTKDKNREEDLFLPEIICMNNARRALMERTICNHKLGAGKALGTLIPKKSSEILPDTEKKEQHQLNQGTKELSEILFGLLCLKLFDLFFNFVVIIGCFQSVQICFKFDLVSRLGSCRKCFSSFSAGDKLACDTIFSFAQFWRNSVLAACAEDS